MRPTARPAVILCLVAAFAFGIVPHAAAQTDEKPTFDKVFKQAYSLHESAENHKMHEYKTWKDSAAKAIENCDAFLKEGKPTKMQKGALNRVRGILFGWLGKNDEALAALEIDLKLHPKGILTLREFLRVHRRANNVEGAEKVCKRVRKAFGATKKDKEETRELLTLCVSDHPSNSSRKVVLDTFEKYLSWASKADVKTLRTFLLQQKCVKAEQACDGHCVTACKDCGSKPWDKKFTKNCKETCQICYDQCTGLGDECHASAKK